MTEAKPIEKARAAIAAARRNVQEALRAMQNVEALGAANMLRCNVHDFLEDAETQLEMAEHDRGELAKAQRVLVLAGGPGRFYNSGRGWFVDETFTESKEITQEALEGLRGARAAGKSDFVAAQVREVGKSPDLAAHFTASTTFADGMALGRSAEAQAAGHAMEAQNRAFLAANSNPVADRVASLDVTKLPGVCRVGVLCVYFMDTVDGVRKCRICGYTPEPVITAAAQARNMREGVAKDPNPWISVGSGMYRRFYGSGSSLLIVRCEPAKRAHYWNLTVDGGRENQRFGTLRKAKAWGDDFIERAKGEPAE